MPNSNADEYKNDAVELIGWGSKTYNGAVSNVLKRATLSVSAMRLLYFLEVVPKHVGIVTFYVLNEFVNDKLSYQFALGIKSKNARIV